MTNRNTKLVLNDLIAKKIQKEQSKPKPKDIYVKSLDGKLTIEPLPEESILAVIDSMGKDESTSNVVRSYDELIYDSIQLFRSPELHKEYEVVVPTDIVAKLLTLAERLDIGTKIIENSGLGDMDDKIKN